MKNRMLSLVAAAAAVLVSGAASARPPGVIWVPITPGPIVVVPGGPVVVTRPSPYPHQIITPGSLALRTPPSYYVDEFGIMRPAASQITHFEVVVGSGSTDRGCRPALKAEGITDNRGVVGGTGVNAQEQVSPTQLVETYQREVPGDDRPATVYQFAVNDAIPTLVDSIVTFMVSDQTVRVQRRDRFGRPVFDPQGRPVFDLKVAAVACNFQVNLSNGGGGIHVQQEPFNARGAGGEPQGAAAPRAAALKAPVPENGAEAAAAPTRSLSLPRATKLEEKKE